MWTYSSHRVLCSNDLWGGSLRIHAWPLLEPRTSSLAQPRDRSTGHETPFLAAPMNSGFALVKPISCQKGWTDEGGIGN